ncbi:hypothetical protein HYC85_007379 [Camellia sinensis]|uniref:Uncharacterized protein n=1 Tax=Camellia sinensis TaxID=4442 RepID=A0A7J7HNS0_CAMSI|nr:hypothetical protein HYC85_007379 [Camellia sinensis]
MYGIFVQRIRTLNSSTTNSLKMALPIPKKNSYTIALSFPSNTALLERASRFSIFAPAANNSLGTSSIPSNSSPNSHKVKQEPVVLDSNTNSSNPIVPNHNKKISKAKRARELSFDYSVMVF